jgi:hypothetical protein
MTTKIAISNAYIIKSIQWAIIQAFTASKDSKWWSF